MDPLGSSSTATTNHSSASSSSSIYHNNHQLSNPFINKSANPYQYQHQPQPQQQHSNQNQQQQHPRYPFNHPELNSNASSWPSSPLIKPNTVGGSVTQQPIIWPNRSNPSTLPSQPNHHLNREPRSPIREESRRIPSQPRAYVNPPIQSGPTPQSLHPSDPNHAINPAAENQHENRPNQNRPQKFQQTKVRITGIERNRRDLYIKFDAWSNLTTTRAGHCPNVSRSYREFLLFHESLTSNNPHTIVPPIPFPNTSAPSPADDDRLVASAFQQFFDRLLLNPFLRTDDELRAFLESDFGYTPQTKPKRRTLTGGSGWLSKSTAGTSVRTLPSSTVQQQTSGGPDTMVSVVEEDELSNAKLQFRLLEDRLADCCRSVEQFSRSKSSLASSLLEVSGRITQFSTAEAHGALAEGFRRLAQTVRAISEFETNSAVGYLVTLSDGLSWCSLSSKAAKDVLRNRAGVLQEHYASVKKSIEKRRFIERIKSNTLNVSSDRVESALEELEEAKKAEEAIAHKATLISANLRPSLRTHSEMLHDDLLYSLMENARTQLIYEKQILKELERVKPELESISLKPANVIYRHSASNAGVDDHRQVRRSTSLTPSQVGDSMISNQSPIISRRSSQLVNASDYRPVHSSTPSTIVNQQHIQPTGIRVGEISKNLIVNNHFGENVDGRQRVDAKSAAASLARLF